MRSCNSRYGYGVLKKLVMLQHHMQDHVLVIGILFVAVPVPVGRFQMQFYRAGQKVYRPPDFSIQKIRTLIGV